jgi:hypothetical protein
MVNGNKEGRRGRASEKSSVTAPAAVSDPLSAPIAISCHCPRVFLSVSQSLCLFLSVSVYAFPPRMSEMENKGQRERECVCVMYVRRYIVEVDEERSEGLPAPVCILHLGCAVGIEVRGQRLPFFVSDYLTGNQKNTFLAFYIWFGYDRWILHLVRKFAL